MQSHNLISGSLEHASLVCNFNFKLLVVNCQLLIEIIIYCVSEQLKLKNCKYTLYQCVKFDGCWDHTVGYKGYLELCYQR